MHEAIVVVCLVKVVELGTLLRRMFAAKNMLLLKLDELRGEGHVVAIVIVANANDTVEIPRCVVRAHSIIDVLLGNVTEEGIGDREVDSRFDVVFAKLEEDLVQDIER